MSGTETHLHLNITVIDVLAAADFLLRFSQTLLHQFCFEFVSVLELSQGVIWIEIKHI